jgi:hypothetical protein
MALKEAARKADPALLEPMMAVEVTTPEDYMGDVIGDLNSRRGQIQAMEERAGARVVRALVPLSEMFGYVGDLRSRTQGRANYTMVFDSYAEVPTTVAMEIIAMARGVLAPDPPPAAGPAPGPRQTRTTRTQHFRPAVSTAEKHQPRRIPQWRRRSSSGPSRTSTSAPSVTSTTARPR